MSEKRHKRRRKQGINNRLVLGIGLLTLWILAFSIAVALLVNKRVTLNPSFTENSR